MLFVVVLTNEHNREIVKWELSITANDLNEEAIIRSMEEALQDMLRKWAPHCGELRYHIENAP